MISLRCGLKALKGSLIDYGFLTHGWTRNKTTLTRFGQRVDEVRNSYPR